MEFEKSSSDFVDRFGEDVAPGKVAGGRTACGVQRRGVDVEGVLSVDHQALRIQPLVQPGWARAGIAYGPYSRANGLAFAVYLLNGHHASQTGDLTQRLAGRLYRWAKGSEAEPMPRRLFRWALAGNKRRFLRQLRRWYLLDNQYGRARRSPGRQRPDSAIKARTIDENLAAGWFPHEVPADPLAEGNALVVHSAGPENGALWAHTAGRHISALNGLQNIPLFLVVILREEGAAYYVASLPGAPGTAALPNMRPLAIDAFGNDSSVYAALYQSVLGQIGFRVDSRVYSTQVGRIAALATWYGTAQAADRLCGTAELSESQAEVGGSWTVYEGAFQRTAQGTQPLGRENLAILWPDEPAGLVHMLLPGIDGQAAAGLVWRFQDADNHWSLLLDASCCHLRIKSNGQWQDIAQCPQLPAAERPLRSLQLLDDGEQMQVFLDGLALFTSAVADSRLAEATGVGLYATGNGKAGNGAMLMQRFETHPRAVAIPEAFVPERPPARPLGTVAIRDDFTAHEGDLHDRPTTLGKKRWRREFGTGSITVNGRRSAQVRASVEAPNPGRLAYTVPWDTPDFADLRARLIPPGTRRGAGEKGRGGLIFWQDSENYIIVGTWLDDYYGGASISSFFHLNGYEELYDAVWTNVGRRIYWGTPYELRVVFDGVAFTAFLDDEPVLCRALTDVYPQLARLAIHRVGIAANWEWGNDTGTQFQYFVALR